MASWQSIISSLKNDLAKCTHIEQLNSLNFVEYTSTVKPKWVSQVAVGDGGFPGDKISIMIRKEIPRGTQNFSQNSDHFCGLIRIRRYMAVIFSEKGGRHLKAIRKKGVRGL